MIFLLGVLVPWWERFRRYDKMPLRFPRGSAARLTRPLIDGVSEAVASQTPDKTLCIGEVEFYVFTNLPRKVKNLRTWHGKRSSLGAILGALNSADCYLIIDLCCQCGNPKVEPLSFEFGHGLQWLVTNKFVSHVYGHIHISSKNRALASQQYKSVNDF